MSLPWYPFFWGDYSSKTLHLTQGQHGAYLLLLRWIYTTGKPIPAKQCYSIAQARLKQEIADTDTVLVEFFEEICGFWHNIKAEEVIAEAQEKHQKLAEAGRAGGMKRASLAQASLKPVSSNYNHIQNQKEEGSEEGSAASQAKRPRPRSRKGIPDGFPEETDLDWSRTFWLQRGRSDLCDGMTDEIAKFRDHHHQHGKSMADWPAAWRTWSRNAIKFNNGAHNGRVSRKSNHQVFFDAASAVAARIQNGAGEEAGGPREAAILLLPSRADKVAN